MATKTTPPVDETLRPVLEQVRKDLLDFGMRNPLLNYRLLKAKGLESVPTDPSSLVHALVEDGTEIRFMSAQDVVAQKEQMVLTSGNGGTQPADTPWRQARYAQKNLWLEGSAPDGYFVADHNAQDLDKRLLATYYAARTSIEEQGVNTLFLGIGMLNWRDPEAPEDLHKAPLLLLPVELERQSASEGFRLRYTNDEIAPNVCLTEFLKQFGIKVDLPAEDEEFDPAKVMDRFHSAIPVNSDWWVDRQTIVLGFFSFAKFLMYRDLNASLWPPTDGLLTHSILQKLLGNDSFAGDRSLYSDQDFLDDIEQHSEQSHVMDADSTQSLALLDVSGGRSMVIQGPPGTGKSQTIVNLIADCLARGKTVLFVSEKKAALEVVRKRLEYCGLGNPCLELHSNKAKKREVISELKRMVDLEQSAAQPRAADRVALQDARGALNQYCRAVNGKMGVAEIPVVDLFGKMLSAVDALGDVERPPLRLEGCLQWTEAEVEQKLFAVRTLQITLGKVGVPDRTPFWGSDLRVILPATEERIRASILEALSSAIKCREAAQQLAATVSEKQPLSAIDAARFCNLAKRIADAPQLVGLDLSDRRWTAEDESIRQALESGAKLSVLLSEWSSRLRPEAWGMDVSSLNSVLLKLRDKWWRFASSEWRSTKRSIAALTLGKPPSRPDEMIRVTSAIRDAAIHRGDLDSRKGLLAELFREYWRGQDSDWQSLELKRACISDFCATTAMPEWGRQYLSEVADRSALVDRIKDFEQSFRESDDKRVAVLNALKCTRQDGGIASAVASSQPFDAVESVWRDRAGRVGELALLASFLQSADECRARGLSDVVSLAEGWEHGSRRLVDLFEYWRVSQLLERAFEESPCLAAFDASSHLETADRFRRLDSQALQWTRSMIANSHRESIPPMHSTNGQLGYLRMMFERRSKFPAIRKLIENAGTAIQALKPVFLMSPLSVANFIPPDSLRFDVVVFDEASQVRPADALGAIARGRQAVVVGDSRQLPPTSFFDSLTSGEDEEEDAQDGPTTDIESVLGLFCSRGSHQRMLRWHYRSRHESLIAGSNHLFYDDRLVVFPSPHKDCDGLGLIYHRLSNAPYDRSRTRTNKAEATAVAEAVMAFAREQLGQPPKERLTLGVATFSVAQRDAVLDQLEILRRGNPGVEEFFTGPAHEPFFVKNLENVQGDERDAIFISVGYGRTAEGYLSMGFGPINRSGGERRLNVLFSRARRRCEVFTTLSADDIDLSGNPAEGLRAFKAFLHLAEHGRLEVPTATGRPPESPFEEQVLQTLQRYGYMVETQVGCAGFFIDMAVVHPERPGRYLIGIECDGATYHSARSARDRDRLRQTVLEDLGWKLYRIWSTAWFRERDREISRLIAAIEASKNAAPTSQTSPDAHSQNEQGEIVAEHAEQPAEQSAVRHAPSVIPKYVPCQINVALQGLELHQVPTHALVDWLGQVVDAEGPIHWLEASRRVANAAGVQKMGSRIQEAFRHACTAGARSRRFTKTDDFLKSPNQAACPIRDRSDLPQQMKRIALIAPEEIEAAIEHVIAESYGISFDEGPVAACRLLGFARVTEDMQTVAERRRDSLLARGLIEQRGEMLFMSVDGAQER